jgi:ribonucleoside-diphosphate reductase alpha chain
MGNKYERLSHERKQLQVDGLAPDWMSTASYQLLKGQEYLNTAETPHDMYTRIANRAAELTKFTIPSYMGYSTWKDAFMDITWKGWLSPSTPVLTNMGNDRGHPIACSGTYLGDSIASFYEARKEIAQLTQRGYGTSWCLDPVRSRGSKVSRGGTANGIMQPAAGVVQDMKDISQGTRRGNVGQYVNVLHPDFDELCDQIVADDDGWNIGWNITEDFKALFRTDADRADYIWKRILRAKMIKGKGYLLFLDKVNAARPQMYKDRGFYIRHSNLCVTGDTKLLTDNGYVPIETVAGTTQNIWDGKEWVETPIFQTSEAQSVVTVSLSNSVEIQATPYHRWQVKDGYKPKPLVKRTCELQPGDKLVKFDLEPIPHGTKELNLAYVNGFHTGDGTVYKNTNSARISLHDSKQSLLPRFSGFYNSSYAKDGRILNLMFKDGILKDKFFVPDCSYSVASRVKWLEGYLDADGTLTSNDGTESIQVVSIQKQFLRDVMLLLQELGIHSTISKANKSGYKLLPANDGTDTSKEFWTKSSNRLLIAGSELSKLLDLGYSASRVIPTKREYQREARQFVTVESVIDDGAVEATYCGTNSKNETLMLNGVQTLNCAEIALMSDKDHSFTCVLSSMNILKYDEWKDTYAVQIATVFLDAVIEDMLIKARAEKGFERVVAFTEKSRALGLGQLGQSSYFQSKLWEFGDFQSIQFNQMLTKHLDRESLAATKLMARELGEPEWLEGYGLRNSHRLAFPPTKSTAIIQGGISEGIAPVYANCYGQDTAGGTVFRINPILLPIMKERGMYNEEVMKRISESQGSVQGEDWLSDHEKAVFKTAYELNQETIILMGSHRQKIMNEGGGGQGQSLNIFITAEETEEEISRLHYVALMDPYLQSLYYIHSLNEESVNKVDKSTCSACEG